MRRILVLTLFVSLSACAGAIDPSSRPPSPSPSAITAHAPARVVKIMVRNPNFIAIAPNAVWVTETVSGTVARIDPVTNAVVAHVRAGIEPSALSYAAGRLWVANYGDSTLSVIDPARNAVVNTMKLGGVPYSVSFGLGSIWVSSKSAGMVYRIDPTRYAVTQTFPVEGTEDVVAGDAGIWALGPGTIAVSRLDPKISRIAATVAIPGGAHSLAFGPGGLWIGSGDHGDAVTRVDPATGGVFATIPVDGFPDRMAFAGNDVWVGQYRAGTVLRIDAASSRAVERLTVAAGPAVAAVGFGSLWVANYDGDSLWRITP